MSFTELFSRDINQKLSYVKKVKVLIFNEAGKEQTYWIDIRNHYKRDDDTCIPTKFGVRISPNELDQLLENMMKLNEYSIEGDKRMVLFKKSDKEFIYDLTLRKLDGKESTLSLTHKEIKKINFIKDKIFINCNFNKSNTIK